MKTDRYYREMEVSQSREKTRYCRQLEAASDRLLGSSDPADRLSALVGAAYGTVEGFLADFQPRGLGDPAYKEPSESWEASKITEAFGTGYQKRKFQVQRRPGETWNVQVLGDTWFWWPEDETARKVRRRLEDAVRKGGWKVVRDAAACLEMEA